MEEKRKKNLEEKKKKEIAQKKAAEQETLVPDPIKPSPAPLLPVNPSVTNCSVPSASSSVANGKSAPSSTQQQQQSAAQRYPPREVPPRFRQHEHKQLLKRGQPLPAGIQAVVLPSSSSPTVQSIPSQSQPDLLLQSGHSAQYESPRRGHAPIGGSATVVATDKSGRDRPILDKSSTEEWPCISRSESHIPAGCPSATEIVNLNSTTDNMSMATGGSQQGHFATTHNGKASNSHSGGIVCLPGAGRGWGSGAIPGEGKGDGGGGASMGARAWGSSNFNLNLNPNANPSAWPVLGHEGTGAGGGSGMSNQAPSNICNPPCASSSGPSGNSDKNSGNGNNGTARGGSASGDASEPQSSSSSSVSFSSEPQSLNTEGPNHTKQEPTNPANSTANWGVASVAVSSFVRPSPGNSQVNGEEGSTWGNREAKSASGSEEPGWDSGSGWGRGAASAAPGWGQAKSNGERGTRSTEPNGWGCAGSPAREQALGSWGCAADAPASEGSGESADGHSRGRTERSSREMAPPLLPARDMDPRVLCNTGWGQTPVRQHTAWETEEAARANKKNDAGTEAWGSSSNAPRPPAHGGGGDQSSVPDPGGKGDARRPATGRQCSGWGDDKKPPVGPGGWGNPAQLGHGGSLQRSGQSWGAEEKSPTWDDSHSKAKPQGWGEGPKPSPVWSSDPVGDSGAGDEWGDSGEGKKNGTSGSAWEGDGTGWKESARGWGKPSSGGGWGDATRSNASTQGWRNKSQEGGNNGSPGGNAGSWGGSGPLRQSGPGWGGSNGGGVKHNHAAEPTGWEEPSPPSVRRKMEIDDGTSAWGDPSSYGKTVNLWDRNNPGTQSKTGSGNANNPPGNHQPHALHNRPPSQGHAHGNPAAPNSHISSDNTSPHQAVAPHGRTPLMTTGWGEMPNVHSKPESSWGEPAPPPASVDNGTSAWGKPPGGWADGGPEGYGRGGGPPGSAPCKPAPKSMQDGWGGGEDAASSTGQWEQDEGDAWNGTASQDSSSSCGSWGNQPKKCSQKAKVSNKQDDAWIMTRLIKQLTDMGFPRDPAEEALKSNNMNLDQAMSALLEKKTESDKRGTSDYGNGLAVKPMSCRPPIVSKDASADKDGGLADDAQTSPFMPSPCLKLPTAGAALPSPNIGVTMQNANRQMQSGAFGGGGGTAQTRAPQQPPPQPAVPPLNSSQPSLRAQVPQFLSPQVQAQLLQFAAKNIGLNPALLTSPINPQHMTLLNQLYHLQLAYQRLQIQQQMLQAQRNVSGPIRQQEQQVARTINNMQQQIQQHQRQLAQVLLTKQQQQLPPSHPGLHPGTGKSGPDAFSPHQQSSSLSVSDPTTKESQSSPNAFSSYTLSGLNPHVNVNCMEAGGLFTKDPCQPQSRLSQWTHPNSVENLSGSSSPMEPGLNKHGLAVPGKPAPDDAYNPYNTMQGADSPAGSLGQSKNANDKMTNGTNVSWPPEFCPGVPWKGLQNIDPETDPNVTPGSVPSGPTINTNIQDVNRYLLRDRSGGKLSDMKSTWSPGPVSHTQTSLSHELWKVPQGPRNTTAPTRPPPGLTNTKPASAWGGNSLGLVPGWSGSYSSGTTWSTDSSNRTSSWLVLRNLTPQIDGSTLRTLCMQHGPLITFHLNLTQGNAVVRYSSKDEAGKAQKSLHMCVLGNTTILAEFAGEEDVNRFFAQGQSLAPATSWQAGPGANQTRTGSGASAASHPIGHWNAAGAAKAGNELLWGTVQQYSSLWGPPSTEEGRAVGSPTPINTLLPGDLLSGESI